MATTYSAPNKTEGPTCPIDLIRPSAINPRKQFDPEKLAELAESIKSHGLLEPIVVREVDGETIAHPHPGYTSVIAEYEIVAGERRWRACKLAGLTEVPVRNLGVIDDRAALELALVENLQRVDLDPIEEAEGYRQLNRVVGLTQAAIATAVKRSQPAVANAMRLLELPEDVRARISAGELSVSHGVALAKWKQWPTLVSAMAKAVTDNTLTTKQAEGLDPSHWMVREVVRNLDSRAHFDRSVCEECPFGARWSVGDERYRSHYCLNAAHWDQLQAETHATQEAELQATIAAGEATGLPSIERFGRNYRRCYPAPPGCTDACTCRTTAIEYGRPVAICTNVPHFDALKEIAEKAAAKQKSQDKKADALAVSTAIDAITASTPASRRELVVLVSHLIDGKTGLAKEAVKRLGIALDIDIISGYAYQQQGKRYRALFRLADRDLVRLGVEILLREDLKQKYDYNGKADRVDWYLKAGTGADDAAPAGEGEDA